MAINYPTSLDTFVNPTGTDPLTTPSHAGQHTDINDAVEALQAKVGVDSSAVSSSLDFKVVSLETSVGLLTNLSLNEKTANYTLVLGDATKAIEMNVATANTLTVPDNATVAFPVGTQIIVIQTGAGATTLAGASGVTVESKDSNLELGGQWAGVTLIKRATDSWLAVGDLA